jgi:hypothetical protein
MPDEYKQLDIAKHILDCCDTPEETQRCGQELLMYQERNFFDLLRSRFKRYSKRFTSEIHNPGNINWL